MVETPRRKEPRILRPWRVKEHPEAFEVISANGLHLAYIYFEDEPTRRTLQNRLTREEARRLAQETARLPDLLRLEKGLPPEAE